MVPKVWLTGWLLTCSAAAVAVSATAYGGSGSSSEYRLLDRSGIECVAADLTGAVFALPYRCGGSDGSGGERRLCTASVALPPANCSRVAGQCGNSTAVLSVAWAEGRFKLELVFRQRTFETIWADVRKDNVTYSYVSDMRLVVDLRDPVFVNASIGKGESPMMEFWRPEKERSLLLFAAPAHSAFVCQSPEEVRLRPSSQAAAATTATAAAAAAAAATSEDNDVDGRTAAPASAAAVATFPAVRLAMSLGGGGVGDQGVHDGDFLCEADSKRHRTGIAALVMAGVIGICMLVIVVGYLATRLSKNSRYTNME